MASLLTEGDLGEISLLVQDSWQRRGLGTALLRRLLTRAEQSGLAALVAHIAADNTALLRTLHQLGADTVQRDGSVASVTMPTAARTVATPG